MYLKTLKGQWEDLCNDFYQDYDILKLKGGDAAALNGWYSVRIHRWDSVAYSEGIILEQQNNPQLTGAILSALRSFRFRYEEKPEAKSSFPAVIAGAAAGGVAAIAAKSFMAFRTLPAVFAGLTVFAVCTIPALKHSSGSGSSIDEQQRQKYLSQLENYWTELEAVCSKFEV